jgi:hypothetical protein
MRANRLLLGIAIFASLAGCTAGWIEEPSQPTVNLVNDLKLEGFSCTSGFSSITCLQIDPMLRSHRSNAQRRMAVSSSLATM